MPDTYESRGQPQESLNSYSFLIIYGIKNCQSCRKLPCPMVFQFAKIMALFDTKLTCLAPECANQGLSRRKAGNHDRRVCETRTLGDNMTNRVLQPIDVIALGKIQAVMSAS